MTRATDFPHIAKSATTGQYLMALGLTEPKVFWTTDPELAMRNTLFARKQIDKFPIGALTWESAEIPKP